MIKRYIDFINESKSSYEEILNIYDVLFDQDLRSDVTSYINHNNGNFIHTYTLVLDNTMILCDNIIINRGVDKYYLSINNKRIPDDTQEGIKKNIFEQLFRLFKNYNKFVEVLINHITLYDLLTEVLIKEFKDRIEEFDIIKNGKIDWISLESLFNFYGSEYHEEYFKKELKFIQ